MFNMDRIKLEKIDQVNVNIPRMWTHIPCTFSYSPRGRVRDPGWFDSLAFGFHKFLYMIFLESGRIVLVLPDDHQVHGSQLFLCSLFFFPPFLTSSNCAAAGELGTSFLKSCHSFAAFVAILIQQRLNVPLHKNFLTTLLHTPW